MNDATSTLSVSQLNRQVKRLLEAEFDYVWVEGEISNFAQPGSGHWYFSLKDSDCQVRCAMFRNRNQRVRLQPGNGLQVRIRARVSLYEGRGEFQLLAEHMEAAGAGALQLAFEQLKSQLQAEGLFEPALKQPLPPMPRRIGVITSPTGAAVRDILSVFARRFPALEVALFPVAVQGEAAVPAICQALAAANRWQAQGTQHFDALIVGRGGGSIEDLWAFNNESVARAIAASRLPVVSAVGHEIDFTIADFVADARAATPSAAAEMLSPSAAEWSLQFKRAETALETRLKVSLQSRKQQLKQLQRLLRHPGDRLRERAQRLDDIEQNLQRGLRSLMHHKQQQLSLQRAILQRHSPQGRLAQLGSQLPHLQKRALAAMQGMLAQRKQRLTAGRAILESLSPQSTLERGYAIVTDAEGAVLRDCSGLRAGDQLNTRLATGRVSSLVVDCD
jgi:exodeoxyribonuclease VII large subunit